MAIEVHQIIIDEARDDRRACFRCTTSGNVFGPTMPTVEIAEEFLRWIHDDVGADPREASAEELSQTFVQWARARGRL